MPDTPPIQTAASHMVTHIPKVAPDTPVDVVLKDLRDHRFACADTVFVVDAAGRLEGLVRIRDLLADGHRPIREIMEPEHEAVGLQDDQEQIAVLAMRLNMIVVPVVDDNGTLVGAVPPEALFSILRHEHMEDLQHAAGIIPHDDGPAVAIDAPLLDRFRRRMPWLVFGLVASSLITVVMAGFEETLATSVAAAFFVPALVYIAGAIGSQAVSVAVRGLANDHVSILRLMRDELVIGLGIGTTLGMIASVAVFAVFQNALLALAVGLAVLGGGAVSAVVGFGLPWVFQRAGFDPAMGSGPICTVIQDVASLSLYFVLVTALVM